MTGMTRFHSHIDLRSAKPSISGIWISEMTSLTSLRRVSLRSWSADENMRTFQLAERRRPAIADRNDSSSSTTAMTAEERFNFIWNPEDVKTCLEGVKSSGQSTGPQINQQ